MIPAETWEEKNIEARTWDELIGLEVEVVDPVKIQKYKISSGTLVSFGYYFCSAVALGDMQGRVGLGHFGPYDDFSKHIGDMVGEFGGSSGLHGILVTVDSLYDLMESCKHYGIKVDDVFIGDKHYRGTLLTGYRKNVIASPEQVVIHTNIGRVIKEFYTPSGPKIP